MNNQEPDRQVEHLLKEGIAAARAEDKATARALLEQVIELDQHNEKGWFWLAAVVDTDEEKRVCLGNVIVINPQNERAQRLLEQLEQKTLTTAASAAPATSGRKTAYLAAALGAIAVVALLLALVVLSGGDDEPPASPTDTSAPAAGAAESSPAAAVDDPDQAAAAAPTRTPSPLPPTWTPAPTGTPANTGPGTPLPAAPPSLGGWIIMQSGSVPGDPANQPIALLRPDGSERFIVSATNERGQTPILSPDSSEYLFVKYAPGTRELILQFNNLQSTEPRSASAAWGRGPLLDDQHGPAWSSNGAWIAFSAVGMGSATRDLYRADLTGEPGSASNLTRLTTDDAIDIWPAFSPGGQFVVYASDLSLVELGGSTELRIYNTADGKVTNLTNNGAALIEAAPDWSPDGAQIVFHALEEGATAPDIYIMNADGQSPPEKLTDSDAADIQPRFSPDGQHIVFSSDRAGNWDVFIYEIATGTIFQVTTDPVTDIANDWGP
jgi:Tol biopolymer transport system component